MDLKILTSILQCIFLVLQNCVIPHATENLNYGLCVDPICSAPIGSGTILLDYVSSSDPSFKIKRAENFDIYVKEYGPKREQWGIQVNGHRGFILKSLVKETQTVVRNLVPAELNFVDAHPNVQFSSQSWHNSEANVPSSIHENYGQFSNDHQHFQSYSYYEDDDEVVSQNVYQSPVVGQQIPSNSYYENFDRVSESRFGMNPHFSSDGNEHFSEHMQTSSPSFVPSVSSFENHATENLPPPSIHPTQTIHQNAHPSPKNLRTANDRLVGVKKNQQQFHAPNMKHNVAPSSNSYLDSSNQIDRLAQKHLNTAHKQNSVSQHMLPESHVSSFNAMHSSEQIPFQETNTQHFNSEFQESVQPNIQLSNSFESYQMIKASDTMDGSTQATSHMHDSVSHLSRPESQISNLNAMHNSDKAPIQESNTQYFNSEYQGHVQSSSREVSGSFVSNQLSEASETPHSSIPLSSNAYSEQMNLDKTPNRHESFSNMQSESQVSNFGSMQANSEQVPFQKLNIPPHNSRFHESIPPHSSYIMPGSFSSNQIMEASDVPNPSVQHHQLPVQNTPMPSSGVSNEEEDLAKTLSLLHKQGIHENLFDNQYSSQPSQTEGNFALTDNNIKPTTSQNIVGSGAEDVYTDPQKVETPIPEYITKASQILEKSSFETKKEKFANIFESILESTEDDEESEDEESTEDETTEDEEVIEDENEVDDESELKNSLHNTELKPNLPPQKTQEDSMVNNANSLQDIEQNNNDHVFKQDFGLKSIPEVDENKFVGNEISNTSNSESTVNAVPDAGQTIFTFDENSVPKDERIAIPHPSSESANILEKEIAFDTENDIKLDSTFNKESKEKILNLSDLKEILNDNSMNSYQTRNLKGDTEHDVHDTELESDENSTEFGANDSFENGLEVIRSFIESVMSWIPEPVYSALMDLSKQGIPPRVPVFIVLVSFPCVLIIIAVVYMKESSKENKLSAQLIAVEKNAYTLSAEKNILEEKLETVQAELSKLKTVLEEERSNAFSLTKEMESSKKIFKETNSELQSCLDEIDMLKQKEDEYLVLIETIEKEKVELQESRDLNEIKLQDLEDSITRLNDIIQDNENEIKELQKDKLEFLQCKEDNEEKITLLEQNCSQLLKEAEVWNLRVTELNEKLNQESALNKELESNLVLKEEEIESLKSLVTTFQAFEELENSSELNPENSKEEKVQYLLNSSTVLVKLEKKEEENNLLSEKLEAEKKKNLDMEVEILDSKSEIDKLKLNYNQALQDKAEAQTKLDVLTNYFKDKEIQLQRQLGAQEAVRQKKEEDASSAERRITLIEQENSSYKYQVASMKQEMEETERNLKSQIAAQEKKAHENWIAARAAERKLEDMKQEVTQLKQRLTMLEREQETWANASQDEIIRPVPKRVPVLDSSGSSQDMNSTMDIRPPWPPLPIERLPPPPMMLPPDRPLPPLHPPPLHPFLPPPPLEPFRGPMQPPWHMPPDSGPGSDFRSTPPEFLRARESTPPRRHAGFDGESGPQDSSPLGMDTRDSRNSTPPHSLPDFHDIPPPHPRPYFPHPGPGSRFPLPPFRRDLAQGPKRIDNQEEFSSTFRGTEPPVPQERWQHSNTRV